MSNIAVGPYGNINNS